MIEGKKISEIPSLQIDESCLTSIGTSQLYVPLVQVLNGTNRTNGIIDLYDFGRKILRHVPANSGSDSGSGSGLSSESSVTPLLMADLSSRVAALESNILFLLSNSSWPTHTLTVMSNSSGTLQSVEYNLPTGPSTANTNLIIHASLVETPSFFVTLDINEPDSGKVRGALRFKVGNVNNIQCTGGETGTITIKTTVVLNGQSYPLTNTTAESRIINSDTTVNVDVDYTLSAYDTITMYATIGSTTIGNATRTKVGTGSSSSSGVGYVYPPNQV